MRAAETRKLALGPVGLGRRNTEGVTRKILDHLRSSGIETARAPPRVEIEGQVGDGRVHVEQGRAYGQGIAITVDGMVDVQGDAWDMRGIVARMGTVQRAIGRIPGVGRVVLGRRKSGLLGTEFRLTGPLDDPEVTVKPISTFTPGILRELTRLKKPR